MNIWPPTAPPITHGRDRACGHTRDLGGPISSYSVVFVILRSVGRSWQGGAVVAPEWDRGAASRRVGSAPPAGGYTATLRRQLRDSQMRPDEGLFFRDVVIDSRLGQLRIVFGCEPRLVLLSAHHWDSPEELEPALFSVMQG